MHCLECIIMANNALWAAVQTAGVVPLTVLLHDWLAQGSPHTGACDPDTRHNHPANKRENAHAVTVKVTIKKLQDYAITPNTNIEAIIKATCIATIHQTPLESMHATYTAHVRNETQRNASSQRPQPRKITHANT